MAFLFFKSVHILYNQCIIFTLLFSKSLENPYDGSDFTQNLIWIIQTQGISFSTFEMPPFQI